MIGLSKYHPRDSFSDYQKEGRLRYLRLPVVHNQNKAVTICDSFILNSYKNFLVLTTLRITNKCNRAELKFLVKEMM